MTIATCSYYRSPGTEPNRIVEFSRVNPNDPATTFGTVKGVTPEGIKEISKVAANHIYISSIPCSAYMQYLADKHAGRIQPQDDRRFSQLTLTEQNQILSSLSPSGPLRIRVDYDIDVPHEIVNKLFLYDPR